MTFLKYPTPADVDAAIAAHEPLLLLVPFDGGEAILSHMDEAVEHHILLQKAGKSPLDIDKYFRVVLDRSEERR